MTQKIRIACDVRDHLPLESLIPFQGDLKSLANDDYQRLRKEIVDTGFAFPIHVWRQGESTETKYYILGGHQRVITLTRMRDEEGFEIPHLPVVIVEADSIAQAKRRILQDVSQYGKIELKGLREFMQENKLELADLSLSFRLPEVNFVKLNEELNKDAEAGATDPNAEWQGMPDFSQENKKSFRHVIVHFPTQEDVDKFFMLIDQKDTGQTKSVWFPPQERMDTESKRY